MKKKQDNDAGSSYGASKFERNNDPSTSQALVKEAIKKIEVAYERGKFASGITTGFKDLNRFTLGFHNSTLTVIAARPNMGKTAFLLQTARTLAIESNVPLAIFSPEASGDQIISKMLSSESGISTNVMKAGTLDTSDWPRLITAAGELNEAPIYIDTMPDLSLSDLCERAKNLRTEKKVDIIFIDSLHFIHPLNHKNTRGEELSEINRHLKALAKELDIPVILSVCLDSRVDLRSDKRPRLSDLGDYGDIDIFADFIVFLYRDEIYNIENNSHNKGIIELIIAKNRTGPLGTVKISFEALYNRFQNMPVQNFPKILRLVPSTKFTAD